MTTHERDFIKPKVSECQFLLSTAMIAIDEDNPAEAKEYLSRLFDVLIQIENDVGCFTPQSLFQEV